MMNDTVRGTDSGSRSETTGSPRAPSRIPKSVIPTWTVLMNRPGSSISDSATRAERLPPSACSSRRVRRAVTSAYSAATNTALPSTRASTARIRRTSLTPGLPGRGYLEAARRPKSVGV